MNPTTFHQNLIYPKDQIIDAIRGRCKLVKAAFRQQMFTYQGIIGTAGRNVVPFVADMMEDSQYQEQLLNAHEAVLLEFMNSVQYEELVAEKMVDVKTPKYQATEHLIDNGWNYNIDDLIGYRIYPKVGYGHRKISNIEFIEEWCFTLYPTQAKHKEIQFVSISDLVDNWSLKAYVPVESTGDAVRDAGEFFFNNEWINISTHVVGATIRSKVTGFEPSVLVTFKYNHENVLCGITETNESIPVDEILKNWVYQKD